MASSSTNPATQAATEQHVCPQCNKHFKTRATLLQHEGEAHIGTVCFWVGCTATTTTEEELNLHIREHNRVQALNVANGHLICHWHDCNHDFPTVEGVRRHLRRHQVKALKSQASQNNAF
ncbi:uncharacterized protein F4822DRAFT_430059 [Hypoxylon trugodes]|uniref:uncharacterized protein n=1 Tax=Hypoxylon trugodes TaxID=326681 RepID=UPI002195A25E|nr:uncharacterized protein F4822DRAFT_430059 [Hypoxylon trugodes]KAI1387304.1 hypothetical protein F4822DRAFT_430059 [Hypoxylon trugodes]